MLFRSGDTFIPMHWGARFSSGAGVNALTLPAIDPFSKQPELKHAAVRVERFVPGWRSGMRRVSASPQVQRAAASLMQWFDYAALSLAESDGGLLCLELAAADTPAPETLRALDELFPPASLYAPSAAQGRAVCACFGVGEELIRDAIAAGATLAKLQDELKCGTNCGSCVPELRRMVAA